MEHLLLVGGLASSLVRFRGPLIQAALDAGHTVTCAAGEPDDDTSRQLAARGVAFHPLPLERAGTSASNDLRAIRALRQLMQRVRPTVALGYTVKPALYTVLAARSVRGIRPFAMLSGLGYALSNDAPRWRPATLSARLLARVSLPQADGVFFHNADDRALCIARKWVRGGRAHVLAGSGVDLTAFPAAPLPHGPLTYLFMARLLHDKGIGEFVSAAMQVHDVAPHARFRVIGGYDSNPRSVTAAQIAAWQAESPVEFGGHVAAPWSEFAGCHVFVLPSYYPEGLPRTLLEAMAVGRAVITTNLPGCREAVRDGNGFLVPPKDADSLAAAMLRFHAEPSLAGQMGARGRRLAETVFDANVVAEHMLQVMGLSSAPALRQAA